VTGIGLEVDWQTPSVRPLIWAHDFSQGLAVADLVANHPANITGLRLTGIPPSGSRSFNNSLRKPGDLPRKARITFAIFSDCTSFGDPDWIKDLLARRAREIDEFQHWKSILNAIPEQSSERARASALIDRINSDDIRARIPDALRRQVADSARREIQGTLSEALARGPQSSATAEPLSLVLAMISARADPTYRCSVSH
jgi:hypothetical protein